MKAALEGFRLEHGISPMGAHVLHATDDRTIVRVMYLAGRIPPDRVWYAVYRENMTVCPLSCGDVKAFETVWR
jgi:hypothetical protein